ncbi:MAG: hypothetical protein CM1200mP12_00390 [Gammaproteobacteria bacterium]|nr:MAG: hypothetical protein CM1200mP12_00390 [Gammaproteobacteria bacterium]
MTYALVDCNSFYASCERVFRPDLKDRPIVVLSNNDGCVVALSKEAKNVGIKMCEPWFKIKDSFTRQGGVAFSLQTMNCMQTSQPESCKPWSTLPLELRYTV